MNEISRSVIPLPLSHLPKSREEDFCDGLSGLALLFFCFSRQKASCPSHFLQFFPNPGSSLDRAEWLLELAFSLQLSVEPAVPSEDTDLPSCRRGSRWIWEGAAQVTPLKTMPWVICWASLALEGVNSGRKVREEAELCPESPCAQHATGTTRFRCALGSGWILTAQTSRTCHRSCFSNKLFQK